MASLADAEEALRSTNAKSNFQRITRLLMSGGVTLLREKLDSIHSPTNLPITLSDPTVQTLLRRARITTPEWNCLYPSPGVYGKSSDFDITLTFRLLRTICNLSPPHTRWNNLPNDWDHSLEADLARIKWYRNKVHGHTQTMEIPDSEFVNLWREISEALLRIAASISQEKGNNWKKAIEKFLLEPLTPEAERYAEELTLWYEKDVDIIRAILRLENTIERFIQCGLVVNPMETHDNQQERPEEIDIWNVIMAFQNSFNLFFEYLENKLNVFVQHFELGSLLIIVECSSLQILDGLWADYSSGHLNKVAQETMVTDEVLKKLGLDEVKLKTFISEEEYEKGKQTFRDNSAPSEQSRALETEAVSGNRDQVESQEADLATPIEKGKHDDEGPPKTKPRSQDSDHEEEAQRLDECIERVSKLESENIELKRRLESIEQLVKQNTAPSERSPVLKEQTASKSQDQTGSGSVLGDQDTATKKEKQMKPTKCDSAAQVILLSRKETIKDTLFFEPATGKLVLSKSITSDKVIAVDMNKAGAGGYFVGSFGFASVQHSLSYSEL